jgi:hypothetical protein
MAAAATTGHKQTSDRVEFCSVPDCEQTDYREVRDAVTWKSEAHHILCVAQVNSAVSTTKKELKKVIDESNWCINKSPNMVALPLWGTTVMYYCKGFASVASLKALRKAIAGSLLTSETTAPDFENLPQHNYGHSGEDKKSSYNLEIKEMLKDWIVDVAADVKDHSITGSDVHDDLNRMARKMGRELKKRGKRRGSAKGVGTHHAWQDPAKNWYEPFCMAQSPKPIPFAKLTEKIVKIAQALWRA